MLEEMSYFSHYLQVTLLEMDYKGEKKTFFKDLVISWPLTRTNQNFIEYSRT